ncbi:hypothetical protein ScPMuIL_004234 [Solemya velum]
MEVDESSQSDVLPQQAPAEEQSKSPEPTENVSCYCGKKRNLNCVELQCSFCMKWFHQECIGSYIGNCIQFITNYQFCCKHCSPTGLENFTRKPASFSQICYTAIANLTHQAKQRGEENIMFSKDKDIIPYIDKQWENLTTLPRRIKLTWHTTVAKTLAKEMDLFSYTEINIGDPLYGLSNQDLYKVGPNIEAFRLGPLAVQSAGKPGATLEGTGKGISRGKRKAPPDCSQALGSKQKKSDIGSSKMTPHGYPLEHPFNKDGYRYILAEPDPHAPNRQAFDESLDWAGKPIPGYLYRTFQGTEVLLALHDRAPQLKISDERLTVTGEKGYSMVRATHGVHHGGWYFEVSVDEMPTDTATRIGWSQALGNLQAPCGYDKFSYSWRSRKGTRFHQSRGKHFSEGGYGEGDVIGFYIYLPEPEDVSKVLPQTYKDRPLVKFKSHLYFEEKDYVTETEKALKPLPRTKMVMFKNGECEGTAFVDICEGIYYPCVSLYRNAKITMNFGPQFRCPPRDLINYRPMSDAASESMVECALADTLYHIENEGKLPEF